jgi:V/A-type H+/Na+-transporting ATPase subunit E
MELQIQDLVTSIQKEGIDVANEKAQAIIDDANKKANEIVAKAKEDAKSAMDSASREIAILKESAIVSADQAKRDAMLAFKTEVKAEFEKILSADVKATLKDDALGKLIKAVVTGEDVSKYEVEVAEVSDALKKSLADEIKGGLEIKPVKGVSAGFKLSAKDGSGYFDCSDEEIMQLLMPYFRDLDF